ncbi:VWA domain-containing protein [Archangium minus]|uniref:VWA domain-containing protein n=1 Tax=Archangium minus TaxID=83450 RepID=A0ABY9X782_9BACT|nr:VWA domain-containing protein [Archangium minus]
MKKGTIQLLAAAIFTLFMQAGEALAQPPPLPTEQHSIIVVDRSGSMTAVRSDGQTRFKVAIQNAKDYVNLPLNIPHFFAVWTFEGSSYIKEQGFASATTTIATLNRLTVGTGLTPLAYTVCDAIDALFTYRPDLGNKAKKVVKLVSDGEENNTPVGTQCYGPSSTLDAPPYTTNSWEWKVYNKFATRNPNTPPPAGAFFPAVLNVTVLSGYISLWNMSASAPEYSPAGQVMTPRSMSTMANYFTFLKTLAQNSGGSYTEIVDSKPAPVFGDTNQDFCVDNTDYSEVLANYGATVPPGNPAADFNNDKVIDYYDYTIVVNNQGVGAGCGSNSLFINK